MDISAFASNLFSRFKDVRIKKNILSLINRLILFKNLHIYSMAKDKNEYDVYKGLLDGSQVHTLSKEVLISCVQERTLSDLQDSQDLVVLHDFCDIRKADSSTLEYLGKVKSLEKTIVNGYQTFNTVVIDVQKEGGHLLNNVAFSNCMPHFVCQETVKIIQANAQKEKALILYDKQKCEISSETQALVDENKYINLVQIAKQEIIASSVLLKSTRPERTLCHVLDREFDNKDIFTLINDLQDSFIIRLKDNRLSDVEKIIRTKKSKISKKKGFEKLVAIRFKHKGVFIAEELHLKNKVYKQVTTQVEYDTLTINKKAYSAVKITLLSEGKPLFKQPMFLITNKEIKDLDRALAIYKTYLLRFKIEVVFRFLKQYLGWETVQVRNFTSIANLLALAFFLVGFFKELEEELKALPLAKFLCKLANSKGKITVHFLLMGLAKIANYQEVLKWMREENISDEQLAELIRELDK